MTTINTLIAIAQLCHISFGSNESIPRMQQAVVGVQLNCQQTLIKCVRASPKRNEEALANCVLLLELK